MNLPLETCALLNFDIPSFAANPDHIHILHSPDEFYRTILSQIQLAQKRIVLSTLYIGTGTLERELVRAVREASEQRNVQVIIFLDGSRGSRHSSVTYRYSPGSNETDPLVEPDGPTCSCDLLAPLTALKGSSVFLYHNPSLRGWLYSLLPSRVNEVLGVQHIKAYVFDDSVLLSGANLSHEYFTTRQDRYWLFERQPVLANFYAGLVRVISAFCFRLFPDGTIKATSDADNPMKADVTHFKRKFRDAVTQYMDQMWQSRSLRPEVAYDTVIYPLLQFGPFRIRTEESMTTWLLNRVASDRDSQYHVSLASGYFNLTKSYESLLLNHAHLHGNKMLSFLCASPAANGFLNSPGLSGYIPLAYRESLIRLCSRFIKHVSPTHPQVKEFCRPGWTFHAKGLWIDKQVHNVPTSVTLIGSSNFSYRSLNRDLESQVAVWTRNPGLLHKIAEERDSLFSSSVCTPVTLTSLIAQKQFRLPWYLRFLYPAFHIFM